MNLLAVGNLLKIDHPFYKGNGIKKVQRSGAEINAQHIEDGNNSCSFNGFRFKSDVLQGLTNEYPR